MQANGIFLCKDGLVQVTQHRKACAWEAKLQEGQLEWRVVLNFINEDKADITLTTATLNQVKQQHKWCHISHWQFTILHLVDCVLNRLLPIIQRNAVCRQVHQLWHRTQEVNELIVNVNETVAVNTLSNRCQSIRHNNLGQELCLFFIRLKLAWVVPQH